MAVSKTNFGSVITLVGTDAEVSQALSDEQVPNAKIINVYFNGTNITAMYFTV